MASHMTGRFVGKLTKENTIPDIQAFVIPRQDASPEELKQLAQAIDDWITEEQEANVPAFSDPLPVDDLHSGELPLPLALRETVGPVKIPRELLELIESKDGDLSLITEEELEEIGVAVQPIQPGALQAARDRLGPASSLRGVRLGYAPAPPNGLDRLEEMAKRHFPEEVIQDILIDGVSWNDA